MASMNHVGRKDAVYFLRHCPKDFNLGDYLCTPLHYFDFYAPTTERAFLLRGKNFKTVLGGGAFGGFGLSALIDPKRTVAWGIGSSVHGLQSPTPKAVNLPYLLYGLRDPEAVVDERNLLPCVSCMHPIASLPSGHETNVFLNFDANITDRVLFSGKVFDGTGARVYWNSMDEFSFAQAFRRTRRVVTNSYHVAYWSFLSGREVVIIGYSSKFRNLLKLTQAPTEALIGYDIKNQEELLGLLKSALQKGQFSRLKSYEDLRRSFIQKNMAFAARCVEVGFVRQITPKPYGFLSAGYRKMMYDVFQTAASLRRSMGRVK